MRSFSLGSALCFHLHTVAVTSICFLHITLSCFLNIFPNRHAGANLCQSTMPYCAVTQEWYCSLKSRTESNAELKVPFWMWLILVSIQYWIKLLNISQSHSPVIHSIVLQYRDKSWNGNIVPKQKNSSLLSDLFSLSVACLCIYRLQVLYVCQHNTTLLL